MHRATVLPGQFGRLLNGPVEGWSKESDLTITRMLVMAHSVVPCTIAQLTVAVIVNRVLRARRQARSVIVRLGAPPLAAPRVLPSVMLEGKGVSLALPEADLCHKV